MPSIRIKLNRSAVKKIAQSQEMLRIVEGVANDIAAAAGPGFEVNSRIGRTRARASVRSETREAMEAEATDRALTRAIDAGRR